MNTGTQILQAQLVNSTSADEKSVTKIKWDQRGGADGLTDADQ